MFELTQENLIDLARASNHDGACRCWLCLHWWAVMSTERDRQAMCPFTEATVQAYRTLGFAVTIRHGDEVALLIVKDGRVLSDDPLIHTAIAELGNDRFSAIEAYAQQQGWQVQQPYGEVKKRGNVD